MVASNGAGPVPIPHKALNHQNLADAIAFCLTPEAQQAARTVADQMRREDGVSTAVQSFHRQLDIRKLNCDQLPQQAADWSCRLAGSKSDVKVSHAALSGFVSSGQVKLDHAKP